MEDPEDKIVPSSDSPDPGLVSPLEEGGSSSTDKADPRLLSFEAFSETPKTPEPNPDQPDPNLESTEQKVPQLDIETK